MTIDVIASDALPREDSPSPPLRKGDRLVQIDDIWVLSAEHARWLLEQLSGEPVLRITFTRQTSLAEGFLSMTRRDDLPPLPSCTSSPGPGAATVLPCA